MRHAKNYGAYASETGQVRHKPESYTIEIIDGVPCCGLCSYPLRGVYRITLTSMAVQEMLIKELRHWRRTEWQVDGAAAILTGSLDVVDAATETFIKSPSLIKIEKLEDGQ